MPGRNVAMQDALARSRLGIGNSRGRSRHVHPVGSNPAGSSRGVVGVPDPIYGTGNTSSKDFKSWEDWSAGKQYIWRGLRGKDPLTGEEAPALYVMDRLKWMQETGQTPIYDSKGKIGETQPMLMAAGRYQYLDLVLDVKEDVGPENPMYNLLRSNVTRRL
jgi:hypothetical protein